HGPDHDPACGNGDAREAGSESNGQSFVQPNGHTNGHTNGSGEGHGEGGSVAAIQSLDAEDRAWSVPGGDRDDQSTWLRGRIRPPAPPLNRLLQEVAEAEGESAADGGSGRVDDPIRTYLAQMGAIPLLSRTEEIRLAKKIETT